MLVLGCKIQNPTSAQAKQWTAILLEDGHAIIHYGGSNAEGTIAFDSVKMGGPQIYKVTEAILRDRMDRLIGSKYEKIAAGYSRNVINLRIVDIDMDALGISNSYPLDPKSEAKKITNAFVEVVVNGDNRTGKSISQGASIVQDTFVNLALNPNKGTPTVSPALVTTAPPVATAPPKMSTKGKIFRPNGQEYKPRSVNGHHDVALLQKLTSSSIFVRLFGPPGGGKTALAEAAFGKDLITVNGHGDFTVATFVGSLLPTSNGGWLWHHGPLTRAMEEGKVFFVDEINRIPTEVLAVMYSVMDGRGVLRIDDRPDMDPIVAKPGFGVVAGYNPETLGAREIDEALLSRFRVGIEVSTDYNVAKALGVPARAIALAKNLHTTNIKSKADGGYGTWVPQMRELLTFRDLLNEGLDEEFALGALLGACPREDDLEDIRVAAKQIFSYDIDVLRLGPSV